MTLIFLGIAGLTLGGGSGWLTGQYGHAIDNLLSVRMAVASGDILTASEKENSDLFWGIRGGGGGAPILVLSQNLHLGPISRGQSSCKPSYSIKHRVAHNAVAASSYTPRIRCERASSS